MGRLVTRMCLHLRSLPPHSTQLSERIASVRSSKFQKFRLTLFACARVKLRRPSSGLRSLTVRPCLLLRNINAWCARTVCGSKKNLSVLFKFQQINNTSCNTLWAPCDPFALGEMCTMGPMGPTSPVGFHGRQRSRRRVPWAP